MAALPQPDTKALSTALRARLEDWRGVLLGAPQQARQIVRRLLSVRLRFTPEPARGVYVFTGEATYGRFLHGILPVAKPLVPPG